MTGVIQNAEALIDQYLSFSGGHFDSMTGGRVNQTELLAALIDQKSSFAEGIRFAQKAIDGILSLLEASGQKPLYSKVFSLEEIAEAHTLLEKGASGGKMILAIQ